MRFPRPFRWLLSLLALLLAAALLHPVLKPPAANQPADPDPVKSIAARPPTRKQPSGSEFPPGLPSQADAQTLRTIADPGTSRLIEWSLTRLSGQPGEQEAMEILTSLSETLRNTPPESQAAVSAAILLFLQSSRDAPTNLPFTVGPAGNLSLSPSLRVALLDLLASLDPSAAYSVSTEVMNQTLSPDEFAIALRNLAWNNLDGDIHDEIISRFNQMIQTAEWSRNPSAGFLEALDTAVALGDETSFAAVMDLNAQAAGGKQSRLSRAVSMVLDRMVVRNPGVLVKASGGKPELATLSGDQRASLMSRLDPTDPLQARLFHSYLDQLAEHPEELDYFAGLFPNGNQFQGYWLVTSPDPGLSIEQRRDKDRAILANLDAMETQDLPELVQAALTRIRQRLAHHLSEE